MTLENLQYRPGLAGVFFCRLFLTILVQFSLEFPTSGTKIFIQMFPLFEVTFDFHLQKVIQNNTFEVLFGVMTLYTIVSHWRPLRLRLLFK